MKHTLEHLPEFKKDELKRLVSVIRKRCGDVEMIILFGSYARGDYKLENDLKPDRRSGHVSDYDILVVTRHKKTVADVSLWHEITKACNALKLSAHPRIIANDIHTFNKLLSDGQYFYSDIKKEGCMLFDTREFKLENERNLTVEEKQSLARENFENWFKSATDFYYSYKDDLKGNRLKLAAFALHQSAEHSYKAVLLVFTNYVPNEHWLTILSDIVVAKNSSFANIFPHGTREEQHRFNLLDYAYISARYIPGFQVSKEDLEIIAAHVKKLLDLTEKVCKQKIKSFTE